MEKLMMDFQQNPRQFVIGRSVIIESSRIEKVWAADFEKCKSREDFEKYISKYGKYESNKYISQA